MAMIVSLSLDENISSILTSIVPPNLFFKRTIPSIEKLLVSSVLNEFLNVFFAAAITCTAVNSRMTFALLFSFSFIVNNLFEESKVAILGERVLEMEGICNFLTSHNSINIAALIKKFY